MSKCEKTCKDCIHCGLCLNIDRLTLFDKNQPAHCKAFKDKSLFVELPCKVGTKIYFIFRYSDKRILPFIRSGKVKRFFCGNNKNQFLLDVEVDSNREKGVIKTWYFSDFGKTVFLTKEEAEKKLKEVQK